MGSASQIATCILEMWCRYLKQWNNKAQASTLAIVYAHKPQTSTEVGFSIAFQYFIQLLLLETETQVKTNNRLFKFYTLKDTAT